MPILHDYALPISVYDSRSCSYRFHTNIPLTQSERTKINGRISQIRTCNGYPLDEYAQYGQEVLHILIRVCRRAGITPHPRNSYSPTYEFPRDTRSERRFAL